jgi:crotonobetainyl-CoA:carnitine CoA-transferase CaiB-like acyl-CoA transferase
VLGGALPGYGLYAAADGWIALAALEPHFWTGLLEALGLSSAEADRDRLSAIFRGRPAMEWERWAADRGLPIVAVRSLPAPGAPA